MHTRLSLSLVSLLIKENNKIDFRGVKLFTTCLVDIKYHWFCL